MREFSVPVLRLPLRPLAKPLLALLVLLAGSSAWACSVPVFRYALEHWQSDPYQVVFYHRGELTPEQEALLTRLSQTGKAGKISANVEVHPVDLDQAKPDDPRTKQDLALWEQQNADSLPWMVVRYPLSIRSPNIIWAGQPTEQAIDQLLDSPQRQEISKRLLKGDTAVWLFLESGNKESDETAYHRLTNELKRCEKELQLPPPDPQDVADGLISVDQASLKIRFSILKLSRDDSQESQLVNMLLDSEEGLRSQEFAGQPMTFPIFGRGRALYGVIGAGINREVIFDACQFLVGPCSCQVKEQNPGIDLLMAVNWDQQVVPQLAVDQSQPPLPVIEKTSTESETNGQEVGSVKTETSQEKAAGESEEGHPSSQAETTAATTHTGPQTTGSRVLMTTLICLAAAVVGIAGVSLFLVKP